MKDYQEQLLKLAGFMKDPKFEEWVRKDMALVVPDFNSLDFLEQEIMPAVRKEYEINILTYIYQSTHTECYLKTLGGGSLHIKGFGVGGSKAEALNNTLEELASEANTP